MSAKGTEIVLAKNPGFATALPNGTGGTFGDLLLLQWNESGWEPKGCYVGEALLIDRTVRGLGLSTELIFRCCLHRKLPDSRKLSQAGHAALSKAHRVFDPPRELFLAVPLAVDCFDKRLVVRQDWVRSDGLGAPLVEPAGPKRHHFPLTTDGGIGRVELASHVIRLRPFHVVQNDLCFRLVKSQVAFAVGTERVTHELRREIHPWQDAKIVVEQADVGMTGRYTLRDHAARAPTGKQPARPIYIVRQPVENPDRFGAPADEGNQVAPVAALAAGFSVIGRHEPRFLVRSFWVPLEAPTVGASRGTQKLRTRKRGSCLPITENPAASAATGATWFPSSAGAPKRSGFSTGCRTM